MEINVNIIGLDGLTDDFDRWTNNELTIDAIMSSYVQKMVTAIKLDTPVDTGFLRGSEGYEKISSLVYEIYADADYAWYVEDYYTSKSGSFFFANIERFADIMVAKIKDKI